MTLAKRRSLSCLIALIMTAAMLACAFLLLDVRYATNDDAGLLRAFLGYETGAPAHFSYYIHGLLALPLAWLGEAFPGIAWFSWMQLALLALASLVSLKSAMQCAANADRPLWVGIILALIYQAAFIFTYSVTITFTQTAALLGAAAVWQILSIDHERASSRAVVWGLVPAAVLVALAYALRQIAALPILAFCGLAWLYCAVRYYGFGQTAKRALRPMLAGLIFTVVLLGGLWGLRQAEIAGSGAQDYIAWQEANEPILDRYSLSAVPQEALDAVGWSANTVSLVGNDWFFLDESISTEAFELLNESLHAARDESLGAQLTDAWKMLRAFVNETRVHQPSLWLLLAAAVLCALLAISRRDWQMLTTLVLTVLGAAAVIFALAFFKGRLPLRAALMGVLPGAALVFALLAPALSSVRPRMLCAACLAALAAFAGIYVVSVSPTYHISGEMGEEGVTPISDLTEYALMNEDMFIIHDLTLTNQFDLFPDMSEGIPHNVTCWGGWALRTPQSVQQFANYDIDLWHFPPETFLREDVLFASGVVDPPPNRLLSYLREKVDPNVDYMLYSDHGYAYFFQFYIP